MIPPAPSGVYSVTANSITLRADFAAVVSKVDALANNAHENGNRDHILIPAVRAGNTWTIPQPLASYKVGSIPNTWRIRLTGTPPAGVTWHTSIKQTFLREGDVNTYPPSTRP